MMKVEQGLKFVHDNLLCKSPVKEVGVSSRHLNLLLLLCNTKVIKVDLLTLNRTENYY